MGSVADKIDQLKQHQKDEAEIKHAIEEYENEDEDEFVHIKDFLQNQSEQKVFQVLCRRQLR